VSAQNGSGMFEVSNTSGEYISFFPTRNKSNEMYQNIFIECQQIYFDIRNYKVKTYDQFNQRMRDAISASSGVDHSPGILNKVFSHQGGTAIFQELDISDLDINLWSLLQNNIPRDIIQKIEVLHG
jgi:hypothetical protein